MTEILQVPTYPLPEATLRSPLTPASGSPSASASPLAAPASPYAALAPTYSDESALSEALTPLISAVIARRARQRRYTP